jgi:hypothetical protein
MNIKHSSESAEHGTPAEYAAATRALMGGVTLDPCSSKLANTVIQAQRFYTKRDDGYHKRMRGRVSLNPPGGLCEFESGRPVYNATKTRQGCSITGACGLKPGPDHHHVGVTSSAKAWLYKLTCDYRDEYVSQAVFYGFTLEILQSSQTELPGGIELPLLLQDFPCCYPRERMQFNEMVDGQLIKGKQPTHANVIAYMPRRWDKTEREKFHDLFSPFGKVTWPAARARRPL